MYLPRFDECGGERSPKGVGCLFIQAEKKDNISGINKLV